MEEKQLRAMLLERLHLEVQLFKDSMLQEEKEDIYSASYRIDMYANFYKILVLRVERMGETLMRELLHQETGILNGLYEAWMDYPESFYMELRDYVEDVFRALIDSRANGGKEDGNGEKSDKAAQGR